MNKQKVWGRMRYLRRFKVPPLKMTWEKRVRQWRSLTDSSWTKGSKWTSAQQWIKGSSEHCQRSSRTSVHPDALQREHTRVKKVKVTVAQLCPVLCDPHALCSPWDSPGQKTGVDGLSLLQGIFPTLGSKPGLPPCRQILYQLSHKGSPHLWDSLPKMHNLNPTTRSHPTNPNGRTVYSTAVLLFSNLSTPWNSRKDWETAGWTRKEM